MVVYWYWRDPRDKKEKPLKCRDNRVTAISRARELNAIVACEMADQVIHDIAMMPAIRVMGTPFNTFAVHCLTLAQERGLAVNTIKTRKSLTGAAIAWFNDCALHTIGVPEIAQFLKTYTDQGKNRYAQSLRSLLIDIWNEAKRDGLLPPEHSNPAEISRRPTAKVNRARLTLDDFMLTLEKAEGIEKRGSWITNSMLLALVTGQRREDIVTAQFRKGRDWENAWLAYQQGDKHPIHPYPHVEDGYFWVIQQKTGALVKIPLTLRLDAIGLSVGDVIERCRDSVASHYLIHHTEPFGNAPRGSAVFKDTVSRGFADARKLTGLSWSGKKPPTFHEIRSLSERLYKTQGIDTQSLLGHRHARMTEVYSDPRQAEWISVKT